MDEVEIPGTEGYFGVLPGHTPMLASLAVGELWYRKGQEKTYLAIAFGFAEVLPDRVTILAKLAERADEIDAERAEAARSAPKSDWPHKTDVDYERARARAAQSADPPAGRLAPRHLATCRGAEAAAHAELSAAS